MYLGERWVTSGPNRNMHKIIYVNVSKSMAAPKRYLYVQIKCDYMEGQLGTQRYKISEIYIYPGDVKRWVTSG